MDDTGDLSPAAALARLLWEANSKLLDQTISLPAWDEVDMPTQNHWLALARVALAFSEARR